MLSRKPIAKEFKRGVKAILKEIRVKGGYVASRPEETPEEVIARALKLAEESIRRQQAVIDVQSAQIDRQTVELDRQERELTSMRKRTDYLDLILSSRGTVRVSQIAADYGMSAVSFNKLLAQLGVQRKINGQWILYAHHQNRGYTSSATTEITLTSPRTSNLLWMTMIG